MGKKVDKLFIWFNISCMNYFDYVFAQTSLFRKGTQLEDWVLDLHEIWEKIFVDF